MCQYFHSPSIRGLTLLTCPGSSSKGFAATGAVLFLGAIAALILTVSPTSRIRAITGITQLVAGVDALSS